MDSAGASRRGAPRHRRRTARGAARAYPSASPPPRAFAKIVYYIDATTDVRDDAAAMRRAKE